MQKVLDYFVKYDRQDRVAVGIVITGIEGVPDSTAVIEGSDSALNAHATASGRETWDEATIASLHSLDRKPEPVVAEQVVV